MVDETNIEEQNDNGEINFKTLLELKTEKLEPYRHGEIADKFKHFPSGYTPANTNDFNIYQIIEALKGNNKVVVPVLSDFSVNVLVEPDENSQKSTFVVEDDRAVYTFLRLEKRKGFLEFVPSGIKVKHEQDSKGDYQVSSRYWSCTVRGVFYPVAKEEDIVPSYSDQYEFLHISHKGDQGIVIETYDPFDDDSNRKRENK